MHRVRSSGNLYCWLWDIIYPCRRFITMSAIIQPCSKYTVNSSNLLCGGDRLFQITVDSRQSNKMTPLFVLNVWVIKTSTLSPLNTSSYCDEIKQTVLSLFSETLASSRVGAWGVHKQLCIWAWSTVACPWQRACEKTFEPPSGRTEKAVVHPFIFQNSVFAVDFRTLKQALWSFPQASSGK